MKRKIVLSSLIWVTTMGLLTACGQGTNTAEVETAENVSDEVEIQEEETTENVTDAAQGDEAEQETEAAEDLSQYAGYYSHSYSEEMEGETLEFSETVQLNEDGSCEVTFQDTIEGTWTKEDIQLADGSKFEIELQDNALKLDRDGEWITYEKVIGDKGVEDYPANEMEARVGKTSFASYDELISLLDENEAYGYATIKGCDQEVLLVYSSEKSSY